MSPKYVIKTMDSSRVEHIGDRIYQEVPSVQFQQQEEPQEVKKMPAIVGIATLGLALIGSIADFLALFPNRFSANQVTIVLLLIGGAVTLANLDVVRVMLGINRRSKKPFDRQNRVTTKKDGDIFRARFAAPCIYPHCEGTLRLTIPKFLGEGQLEAVCSDCPNEHLYVVDQNLVAIPK